jgi:hypothetical protein
MTERIWTLHPQEGKRGVHIDKAKYDVVRQAILDSLAEQGEIPWSQLPAAVEARLAAPFEGAIGWYTISVKLDLEARGIVERVPGKSPQVLRLRSA